MCIKKGLQGSKCERCAQTACQRDLCAEDRTTHDSVWGNINNMNRRTK